MAAELDASNSEGSPHDALMMARCIQLAARGAENGELPIAGLISKGSEVLFESSNRVVQAGDITQHAELVAISESQKILGRRELKGCTLYTTVEPCAMCSHAVREARVARVVFAIRSPIMGGLSKWNVLRDGELSRTMPEVFGDVPEVIAGYMREEAEKAWQTWNPLFWAIIKNRGYLGGADPPGGEHMKAIPGRRSFLRKLFNLHGHLLA